MEKRTARVLWCWVVVLLAGMTIGVATAPAAERYAQGEAFPSLNLPDVEGGRTVDVKDYLSGSVGAVVFMQTSCAACRKELLALKELRERYPGIRVVAISVDSGSPARVKRYREHFGFQFPFLHDPEFKTPGLFGFSFTPALVLVDGAGTIALLKGGYRPGDEKVLETRIRELLAKQ
ncbi:TlpA family protein disulfide reductase [Deferrisoma camini]|uniref:TlpA family protein disulfide reductase n=1 Tax=Deferrisoma camini TaxID=1035120 RepID=UPI00046D7CCC|nr:TlpA disulfide reductase family protein [Deferrisoma camini]